MTSIIVVEHEWWNGSHKPGWVCKRTRMFFFSCNLMDSTFTSILVHVFIRRTGNSTQMVWSWKFKKKNFIRGMYGGLHAQHFKQTPITTVSLPQRNNISEGTKRLNVILIEFVFHFFPDCLGKSSHIFWLFLPKVYYPNNEALYKKTTTQACVYNYFSHRLYQWTTKTSRQKEKRIFWKWLLK